MPQLPYMLRFQHFWLLLRHLLNASNAERTVLVSVLSTDTDAQFSLLSF